MERGTFWTGLRDLALVLLMVPAVLLGYMVVGVVIGFLVTSLHALSGGPVTGGSEYIEVCGGGRWDYQCEEIHWEDYYGVNDRDYYSPEPVLY